MVKLVFGDEVVGTLARIDKFEMCLTQSDGSACIVFKGAVATVTETTGSAK